MLALIVEEFTGGFDAMEMSMWLYYTTTVAIAILMTQNIFTAVSDSGRVTFYSKMRMKYPWGRWLPLLFLSAGIGLKAKCARLYLWCQGFLHSTQ